MSIEQNLRTLQDQQRNTGWRIRWIAWQASGRPEYVYNTPATKAASLTGAAVFVAGCVFMRRYHLPALGLAVAGLVLIVLTRVYAAWRQRHNWVTVAATCLDSEIRQGYAARHPGLQEVYELRLLCGFSFDGQNFTVTPEINRLVNFNTSQAAEDFLTRTLRPNRSCTLLIDPDNPLHARLAHQKMPQR